MVEGATSGVGGRGQLQSPVGCFVWLGWMIAANVALVALAILIVRESRWTLTAKDAVFWAVVAAALALRHVDLEHYGGRSPQAGSSAPRTFARYAAAMLGTWGVLWALAHSVQWL